VTVGGEVTPGELVVEAEPRLEDVAALDERLYRYNVARTGHDDGRWLAIFIRDDTGALVAGLHGWTWGGTGFIRTLWVRDDCRQHGRGTRLVAAAEREALRRGCGEMHLDTHSYQAPDFYRRLGYEEIGVLPGWPGEASTRLFFRKSLAEDAGAGGPTTRPRPG
jgi:GNAT superfamily N-acetyltransferase